MTRIITISDCFEAVAQCSGIELEKLRDRGRRAWISRPRQIGMLLARQMVPTAKLSRIGEYLGRDHTTVLSGINRAAWLAENDDEMAQLISDARAMVERKTND